MKELLDRKSILYGLSVFVLSVLAIGLFSTTTLYKQIEYALVDARFKVKPVSSRSSDVVHIDIDDRSIQEIGRWPWNRNIHAKVVQALKRLGAETVVFDVLFPDPQNPTLPDSFLQNYDRLVRAQFKTIQQESSSLHQLQNQLQQRKQNVKPEDITHLKKMLRWLDNAVEKTGDGIISIPRKLQVHPDKQFAKAVEESGNTILSIDLKQEDTDATIRHLLESTLNRSVSGNTIQKVEQKLIENIFLSADELSESTGLQTENLEPVLPEIKRITANKIVRAFVTEHPTAGLQKLINNMNPPRNLPYRPHEISLVRNAYNTYRSRLIIRERFGVNIKNGSFPRATNLVPPVRKLTEATAGVGHINEQGSPIDGKLRRVSLVRNYRGTSYFLLGFRAALYSNNIDPDEVTYEDQTFVLPGNPEIRIPVNSNGQLLLNWDRRPWNEYGGQHLSYDKIYQLCQTEENIKSLLQTLNNSNSLDIESLIEERQRRLRKDEEKDTREILESIVSRIRRTLTSLRDRRDKMKRRGVSNRVLTQIEKSVNDISGTFSLLLREFRKKKKLVDQLKQQVRGATCFIGSTHTGSTDIKPTPVSPRFPMVSVHSTVFNMINHRNFLVQSGWPIELGFILAGALAGVLLAFPRSVPTSAILTGFVLLVYTFVNGYLFMNGYLLEFVGFPMSLVLAYSGSTLINLFTVEAERKQTRELFERYVDRAVVREILKNPETIETGGSRKRLTIFFMDMENFTRISEKMSPVQVVELLSSFLSDMTDIIFDHEGTLDKYEGDAIMAYWGAPVDITNPELKACRAALACVRGVTSFNERHSTPDIPELNIRIGLNTGSAVIGNIGSRKHSDYTVLGDQVNLAARLEEANKHFGTRIIVSESTYREVNSELVGRELCMAKLKGLEAPVKIFELVGEKSNLTQEHQEFLHLYDRARNAFLERNWDRAEELFSSCLKHRDDSHCERMIERIRTFKSDPPPEGTEDIMTLY